MKIDPRIQLPSDAQPERVKNTGKGGTQSQGVANTSGVSSAAGEDTVKLSSAHGEVQTLAASLNKVPEVRTERVQALQQRVQSGQYNPDSKKVADAIIKDHIRVNTKA
jgi:negative regulator of flagellin synthesis FlgM